MNLAYTFQRSMRTKKQLLFVFLKEGEGLLLPVVFAHPSPFTSV